MTTVRVHLDTEAGPVPAGAAEVSRTRGVTTTRFTYLPSYLSGPGWDLSPDLSVVARESLTDGLPGAFEDSSPDTWGRNLITRRLARDAARSGQPSPAPTELDYLLGVSDLTRQGALRFSLADRFLAEATEVPQLLELARLLEAATTVAGGAADADEAVAALLDAGSGSLGGARPKASISDGPALLIAKFPHPDDRWDVMRWESVTLELAQACGLTVPRHRLEVVGLHAVLLVQRFDRRERHRVPYLSARSLTGGDAGAADYLELAEAITDHGSDVDADLRELWQRIAFSILVNNTDDHLRNHGFLRDRGGWKLSPLFDVNPNPNPSAARVTSLGGETSTDGCHRGLFALADRFGLDDRDARQRWAEMAGTVRRWRGVATAAGIPAEDQGQFAETFDRWTIDG